MTWLTVTLLFGEVINSMRILIVFAAAIGVAACAAQQHSLTTTTAASLKGRRVAVTTRPPTPLLVTKRNSPGAMGGGLFGATIAADAGADAGARIVHENAIADPRLYMALQLSNDLRRQYGLKLEQQALYVAHDDPRQIVAGHPETDLLLDVWVDNVTLEPLSADSSGYRLKYLAYVRLIDAQIVHLIDGTKGLVIADGMCAGISGESPSAPTYDEFLANGAQRLKHELDLAARSCVDVFRSKVLTVSPTH